MEFAYRHFANQAYKGFESIGIDTETGKMRYLPCWASIRLGQVQSGGP